MRLRLCDPDLHPTDPTRQIPFQISCAGCGDDAPSAIRYVDLAAAIPETDCFYCHACALTLQAPGVPPRKTTRKK